MATSQPPGLYLLSAEHADAVRELASDPAVAEAMRDTRAGSDFDADDFVAGQTRLREEGIAYGFAIVDGGEVVGVITLAGIYEDGGPDLCFRVGRPHRRRGYATFGVKMALEFAFQNLRLERVRATAPGSNPGACRELEKNGFEILALMSGGDTETDGDRSPATHELRRRRSTDLRDNPALARLHPALREILEAELAAGNEVMETGGGFPDPDSVFVRLRHPFRTRPSPVANGVVYSEPNDPHWWMADYSSRSPRHVLAC